MRLHCNVCNIAKGNGLCKVYRFIYAPTPHAYPPSLPTYPIPSQVISLWRECRTMGPLCESITNRCQLFPLLTMGHVIILYSLTNCMFYQPLFYYLPSRTFNSVVFQSSSNVKWRTVWRGQWIQMLPVIWCPPLQEDKYTHGETNERFLLLLTGLFCCSLYTIS